MCPGPTSQVVAKSTLPKRVESGLVEGVKVTSTGRRSDQYWSHRGAVLVTNVYQYWSMQRPVLLHFPSSVGRGSERGDWLL